MRWVIARGQVDAGEGPATQRSGAAFIAARDELARAAARGDALTATTGVDRADDDPRRRRAGPRRAARGSDRSPARDRLADPRRGAPAIGRCRAARREPGDHLGRGPSRASAVDLRARPSRRAPRQRARSGPLMIRAGPCRCVARPRPPRRRLRPSDRIDRPLEERPRAAMPPAACSPMGPSSVSASFRRHWRGAVLAGCIVALVGGPPRCDRPHEGRPDPTRRERRPGRGTTATELARPPDHLGRAWTSTPAALFLADQLAHLAVVGLAWAMLPRRVSPAARLGRCRQLDPRQPLDRGGVQRVVSMLVVLAGAHDRQRARRIDLVSILVRPVEEAEGEYRWGGRAGRRRSARRGRRPRDPGA